MVYAIFGRWSLKYVFFKTQETRPLNKYANTLQ